MYVVKRHSHYPPLHARSRKKGIEKHENEIIEIKMVLNITHGATIHICTHNQNGCYSLSSPWAISISIYLSRFIYFTGHFSTVSFHSLNLFVLSPLLLCCSFSSILNHCIFCVLLLLFVWIVTFYKSWQDNFLLMLPLNKMGRETEKNHSIVTVVVLFFVCVPGTMKSSHIAYIYISPSDQKRDIWI